jgi:hypothetical protein
MLMLFQCTFIEGSRTFNIAFGAVTAVCCLSVGVPTLWWVLPNSRVWLFSKAIDRYQGIQLAYGIFCMSMAFTDALCRAIPHGHLPWVHPAFFLTTLLIVFGLGPRVAYVALTQTRLRRSGTVEATRLRTTGGAVS